MDYPQWTLLGMGLSILGALVALAFALIAQSPGLVQRLGLGGARLDLRVRTFTSYAFALLLLSIGFFLAGIPVGDENEANLEATGQSVEMTGSVESTPGSEEMASEETDNGVSITPTTPVSAGDGTPETGSFAGPPPTTAGQAAETSVGPTRTAGTAAAPDTPEIPPSQTDTPRPTFTPTQTPSPTPTQTPSPTITPTPITGETARVSSGGSTIWIVRSPGGQNVVLVRDGDTVLLMPGHANQAGQLWREIRTVAGVLGWIQEIFLDYGE